MCFRGMLTFFFIIIIVLRGWGWGWAVEAFRWPDFKICLIVFGVIRFALTLGLWDWQGFIISRL